MSFALKLDVVVVGAGLAGLAATCALAVDGHRIRLFEKSPGIPSAAGGIRLPPNAAKVLVHMGMQDEMYKRSVPVAGVVYRDLRTGELIGGAGWVPVMFKDSGAVARVIDHRDLCDMLYQRAISAGAKISFNSEVAGVCPPSAHAASSGSDDHRPSVELCSGEVVHADVIIGADGAQSILRPVVDAQDADADAGERWKGEYTGTTVYTGVCPAEEATPDEGCEVDIWMSDGFHAMSYGTRRQEIVLHIEHEEEAGDGQADWERVPPSSVPRADGFAPRLQRMLERVPYFTRARCYACPPADEWVDASETIILLGQAAHYMLPHALHQSSNCLESAAVLATLLSHLRAREQLPSLLYAYHDLRAPRAARLHALELKNRHFLNLAGDQRAARDAALRAAFAKARSAKTREEVEGAFHGHGNENGNGGDGDGDGDGEGENDENAEGLARQFAELLEGWGYDACEEAEEWWVRWGLLKERASVMGEDAGEEGSHQRPGTVFDVGGVLFAKHTIEHV